MKGKWKRLLAAVLAASIIFGNAVPAYATESGQMIEVVEGETEVTDEDAVLDETSEIENSDVTGETESGPVEETTEEEAEETESETTEETTEEETETEPVEEGDSEEVLIQEVVSEVSTAKTYDTVEDYSKYYNFNADESGYLSIEFFDSENFSLCLDSAIAKIDEVKESLSGDELANVDIMIDDYNGNIPAKLWNALASYMNKSGNKNGKIMFHFRSSKGMYNKWSFRTDFTTVESDIDVQATATVSEQGITVKFTNTTFPASSVGLFIQADNQDESLGKFETAFGKNYVDGGMDLEIWNNGAKLDHSVKYFYDSTGDCTELRIDDVQTLSADNYGIKAEAGSESEIYTGTVEDKSIGKVLYISYEDVLSGTFSNSTIENALEARSENNESYAQIAIIYPAGFSTTIPANIWNYIAGLSDTSMRPARFQFAGGNYVDWEWNPACMRETSSSVALNGSFSVDAAELKGTLTLSDVDIIPADRVGLRISTSRGEGVTDYISGNKEDYSDIVTVFGTGFSDIEVYNNNSLVASGGYQQYGDDTGVNAVADFLINDVKEIGSGVYKVLKAAYGGEEFQWSDGTTCFGVFVSGFEKYGESFSEEALLEILTNKAGTTFDRVSLTLPEGTTSISKGIWNAAVALLNSENGENNWLNVSIPGEDHEVQWAFQNPLETNYEDGVSIGYEFIIAEKTIKFDQTAFPAEFVSWGMNTAKFDENIPETYEAMTQSFGTSTRYLDVMDEDYYRADSFRVAYTYDEDYGDGIIFVNIIISDLLEADAGMCYTIDSYHGSVNSEDDGRVLFIDYGNMVDSLKEFNDDTLKEILTYWAEKDICFERVEIQAPISYQSVSKEVWNAAVALLDNGSEDRGIQINFYREEAGTGFWFGKPEETNQEVSLVGGLEFDKKIGKNEYRDMLEFENTDYPAEYVHWNYWADSDNESMKPTIDKLYNKFGAESTNVALYDAVGNSPENVGGHFNAEYGNGGSVHYNLGFGNIKNLLSKTMYGVWPSFYWGDISKQENGQVRLTIDPWNAGRDGKIFETNQIRERLKHHKDDFNQIEFVIPWSERNTIFADWIELAKEHLTPNKSGDFFVIFTFVNNEEEYVYEVWITNPGVGTTEDVTFECILAMDEETGVVNATVGQMSLDAGAVFIQYHGSSEYEGGFGNQLETYIGGNWDSCYPMTDVNFPQVEAAYRIYNGWHDRHFEIYNPNGFGEKESYQFAFELNEYVGKIRGEGTSEKELYIDINEFEVYGLEAKDDVLIDIITQYADAQVNWVVIDNYRDDVISKEVWNAAVGIMTGDSQVIRIHQRASEEGKDWWFEKPSETSQIIQLKANFNFEDKTVSTVSFDYTDYPAEHIACNYWTNNGDSKDNSADAKHQAMRKAFGTRYTRISVLDENGKIIVDENKNEPVDLNGEYNVYAGENDYYDLNLNIWNIKNMTANTVYKLEARDYEGDLSWHEGDQTRLTFDYWSAWREDGIFDTKEIDRILGERNEKYNQIEFVIPWSENNKIYGEWIELANAYLTKNENGNRFVIFTFVNNEEEYTYEVWFTNPGLTQIDTVFNCDLSVDEETKTVNAKIGKIAVNAESAFIQYHGPSGRDDSFAQQMERTFGGNWESYYQMADAKYPKVEATYSIYEGWGGYDRHFEIYNNACFDDAATYNYAFKLDGYRGSVYDGEDGEVHLKINMDDFGVLGFKESEYENELMDVFSFYKDQPYKFTRIELENYPYEEVSTQLWNAAVAILKGEYEQVLNIRERNGEEGEDWWFAWPKETETAVSLNTGVMTFVNGKCIVSFSDTVYPVHHVDWNYWTNNGDDEDNSVDKKHQAMKNLFGNDYTRVAVVDSEKTVCEGEYNVYKGDNGSLDLNVNLWNIMTLTAGKSYFVEPRAYAGELDNGFLTIDPRHIGRDEGFTLEELKTIIDANASEEFQEIRFVIPKTGENKISKEIVNKVLANDKFIYNDYGRRAVRFHFADFKERTDYEVCIVNPAEFEEDIPVQVNLSINTDHIYADINELPIPLEEHNSEVYIRCYEDPGFDIGELIKKYFGIPDSGHYYYAFDSNVEHISANYYYDDNEHNSVIFEIYAGNTGFDQEYRGDHKLEFEFNPYVGNVFEDEEGYYRLEIKEYEANEAGMEFNDDTIIRLLKSYEGEEKPFDIVHIEYNHGECIDYVSANVWNTAVNLLGGEEARLEIHSGDDKGNGENWFFFNPYETEDDIVLDNKVIIGKTGELAQVRFENTKYPAVHAQLSIWADYATERSNYNALVAAFGTDNRTFDLLDEEGNIWQDDGGEYYLEKERDEEGNTTKIHGFGFNVGNVNNLRAEHTYTLCPYAGYFKGDEYAYETLYINSWDAGKKGEAFTLEEIASILEMRKNESLRHISIIQKGTVEETADGERIKKNEIAPEIANKMVQYLTREEDIPTNISFEFAYGDQFEGTDSEALLLVNPGNNPFPSGKNTVFSANLVVEDGKAIVTVDDLNGEIDAEQAIAGFNAYYDYESGMGNDLRTLFGGKQDFWYGMDVESSCDGVEGTYGSCYVMQEERVYIEVDDDDCFAKEGKHTYTVTGRIDYNGEIKKLENDRQMLCINAWDAGYGDGVLPDWEMDRILNYHREVENSFVSIEFVQAYNEQSNVISGYLAELASGLLNKDGGYSLLYTYCFTDESGGNVSLILERPDDRPLKTNSGNFNVNLSFNEKGQPVVSIDSIAFKAERQLVRFDLPYEGDWANKLAETFGGLTNHEYRVTTSDANATGIYDPGENGIFLEFVEPDGFNVGGTYTLTVQPYLGNVYYENGSKWLSLYHWEMLDEGIDLKNDTQVVSVLNKWKALGEKFDVVELYYKSAPGTISYKVWNAARALLNSVTDGEIRIVYDEEGIEDKSVPKEAKWTFRGPKNTSGNITLSADWDMEKDEILFGNVAFPAVDAYIGYHFIPGEDFELGNGRIYKLYKGDQPIENGLFYANYSFVDDEDNQWIYFGDIRVNGLEEGVVYGIHCLEKEGYDGEIFVDAKGNRALVIRESELFWYGIDIEADDYDIEEWISKAIDARTRESFDNIFVDYANPEKLPETISPNLWNKMVGKLSEGKENIIGLSMPGPVVKTDWIFVNPYSVDNTAVNIESGFTFDGKVKVDYTDKIFPAEDITVAYNVYSGNPAAEELIDIYNKDFGMKDAESIKLSVEGKNEPVAQLSKWNVEDGEEFELYIEDADALMGSDYVFTPYNNPNDIWVIGKGNEILTSAQISEIAEEANQLASKGKTYGEIVVIQQASLSNTIKKELINALRPLLNWKAVESNPKYEVYLKFVFVNDENDRIVWDLINPGTAVKDINANVIFNTTEGNGALVRLNKNTYNAARVRVAFEGVKENSDTFSNLQKTLGEIDKDAEYIDTTGDNVFIRLAALKKSSELQNDIQCVYFNAESPESVYGYNRDYKFIIDSAQNLAPGVDYLFDQYLNKLDPIVGVDTELESGMWKVLTPNTAVLTTKDGNLTLTPLNEGDIFLQRTYIEGESAQTEIWRGAAKKELVGITLNKEEIKLSKSEFAELMVLPNPSIMNLDKELVVWDITVGEKIIAIESNETKATIKAIGEGEATVTVSYGGYSASCKVVVVPAFKPQVPGNIYALTNFDTKLSDIEDQLVVKDKNGKVEDVPYKWEWKAEKTSITPYFGLVSQKFTAVCTERLTADQIANGDVPRTVERDIEVHMITIEGIEIVEASGVGVGDNVPAVLLDTDRYPEEFKDKYADEIRLEYRPIISVAGITIENPLDTYREKIIDDYFRDNSPQGFVKWTLPKGCVERDETNEGDYWYEQPIDKDKKFGDVLVFKANADKPGNKTFTATLVTTKNKVVVKDSVTVTVLKKPILDMEFVKQHSEYDSEHDVYIFRQPSDNYHNLSFAISDKSVLKKMTVISSKERYYKSTNETYSGYVWETRVQCTEGVPGFTNITVTAADELKSKIVFGFKVIDDMPKVLENTFELNKAYEKYSVPFTIQFPDDAMPTGSFIVVGTQHRDIFDIQYDPEVDVDWVLDENGDKYVDEDGNSYVRRINARLVFSDKEASKTTTYKNVVVEVDTANDIKELKVNVKVINKAPKVTVKQTKNINVFYKDMYGVEEDLRSGLLTVTAPGLNVEYANILSEGFCTDEIEPGVFKLCTEHNEITKGTYKNVYVGYSVYNEYGACYSNEAKLTIKVDEKAPTLVLSEKSDTLYPSYGAFESSVEVLNKATGKPIRLSEATFVENRKKGLLTPIYTEETDITLAKNTFAVSAAIGNSGWLNFRLQEGAWKNATAKFAFDVKEESWNKAVSVSYSVKVNVAKPTLKLGSSKLTLNMNAEVANYQMATTTLKLNDFNGTNVIDECNIQFVGADAKSTAVLNNVLTLDCNDSLGSIVAELHPNAGTLTKGTYKFKVNVTNEEIGYAATATLTISIVDTAVAKCVKLSKKGSIDVLRRDTTCITYTPKLTNLAGRVTKVDLLGVDEDKFDVYLSEDGNTFEIYAKDVAFSTKASYSIIPVITLETNNGEYEDTYEVTLPAQSIKVTQGKPKATFTAPNGNVLYTQHGGDITLDLATVLGGENIEVANVSLANYTSDLKVADCWTNESNGTTIYLRASDNEFNQINKTGKTWSLKFEVTYADKAVDQKPVTVTYKVTIK